MDTMPPLDLDRLLTDTTFVRRIARALVRDPHAAEDLAQDALVVALERPPGAGTNLRGWLVTVVRSLAIDRARRAQGRPRNLAPEAGLDHAPGPDEIVARLDLSRQVAGALSELEEPYRTTLYLRYVEELDPPSISTRLGVPLATTKTRLRRGLELLRVRLDRECGGRAAWSALAVPFAVPPTHAALGAGALLMSTAAKVAAALCLCGAAAWLLWPKTPVDPLATGPSIAASPATDLADPQGEAALRQSAAVSDASAAALAQADRSTQAKGPFVRVLDERRFPVEGAHVVLHVQGFGDDETTTDAQGIARFTTLSHLEDKVRGASLLAWDDRGRVGARSCGIRQIDEETMSAGAVETLRSLGDLLIAPGGALRVRVDENSRPAANANVWLELGVMRTAVVDAVADSQGRVRFEHLPAGQVVVRAAFDGREGRAVTVLAPGREDELVVRLRPARTIEVTVVEAQSKAPIAGASIRLAESFMFTGDGQMGRGGQTAGTSQPLDLDVPPTDANGRTRVVGLPAQGQYTVEALADSYVGPQPPQGAVTIKSDSDSLTLELSSLHERRARWPLVPGEVAPPPPGTPLTLRRETVDRFAFERYSPPPTVARIEDGAIVAEGVRDRIYGCYAIAPDGSLARLWIDDAAEEGHPTSFRRPRRIDVKVLDTEGRPAVGVSVEVRNQGNNLLLPAASTDEVGAVSFEGLWGRRTDVYAERNVIGTVDLEKGDGRIEARLPRWREVTVRLLIDGRPGLPPSYRVWTGGETRVLSEDPALGILRLQFVERTEGPPTTVSVDARGFLLASVPFPGPSAEPSAVLDVDLHRDGALLAHVRPPASGHMRVRAEAWDVEKGRWRTGTAHQVNDERYSPNAPDGGFLFGGLASGRYRVRDVNTGRVSEGVEVVAGESPAEVALDLADSARVRGLIELPAGVPPWLAHVLVEGEGITAHEPTWLKGSERPDGHYVDKEGRFEVFVGASKPVTLRAAHPYLSPDPKHGTAVIRGETLDVRLKLVEGDEVQIPLAAFEDQSPRNSLRVYAYAGDPVGEPKAWFHAHVADGVARFSGLPRGTWTLWIDPEHRFAPIVARDVSVGAGITRVDLKPSLGSTLRVRLLHAEGTETPHFYVSAKRKNEPMLIRSINSRGEDLVVLSGLDSGTYHVGLSKIGTVPVERTLEFDGQSDIEIEFDLRDPK